MHRAVFHLILCLAGLALLLHGRGPLIADEATFSNQQLDFFENRIRPLIANHCLECHGPDKSENDLRLDSREAILKGGSSGEPGAIPAEPDSSLIIQSVRHAGDYEMPPDQQLSHQEIADLAQWIKIGLPWPSTDAAIAPLTIPELMKQHRQTHWSFQPVVAAEAPSVRSSVTSTVDRFVVSKLETKSLSLSPRADPRTLIRRAYFDLTGLPPTFGEVESFVNDDAPDAYANMIDRLLDSPHYGERWARHWLDVARYSDTSGYTFDNGDRNYPFAFTYRDYVIDALNSDLPYDQFIREQLAADHLDVPEDNRTLAALGFITVGRKYIHGPDTIDDQVDVVTRGLMGLTVSCARCHDHKYDAIPTEDYYSLYSVFSNNDVPDELPLLGGPSKQAEFKSYFEKRDQLKQDIEKFGDDKFDELQQHIQDNFADYLARVIVPDQESLLQQQSFIKLKRSELRPKTLAKWRGFLARAVKTSPGYLQPSLELINLPDESFADAAAQLIKRWSSQPKTAKVNPLFLAELKSQPPESKLELARIHGELFSQTLEQWKSDGSKQPPIGQFKDPRREIASVLFAPESPVSIKRAKVNKYLNQGEGNTLRKLKSAINKHDVAAPEGLARAMVLRDKDNLHDERVMIRGNHGSRGNVAPRRFVALLSEPAERPIFQNKSGRLDLANKIASTDNPLTARVLVNRVWMHHFSTPLVDTPSDFGIRCEEPVQRDLLDHLAHDFMEQGWSIKHLHRQIMLSDTYCQASIDRPDCGKVDPENRMYWKMNRRRLEFEPLRDSVLAVTGQLDRKLHGRPIKLHERPGSKRRTIYGLIDRQDLPGLYRVFDLASPDQSAAKRIRTTVPQQSLFMMNSFFLTEHARHLIDTVPDFDNAALEDKVTSLYETVYQRKPAKPEIEIARRFMETAESTTGEKNLTPWQRYAQMLLCANEFEFIG